MLLPAGTEPELAPDEVLVAVDLDGRAPADALERGEAPGPASAPRCSGSAPPGWPPATRTTSPALVPDYVTLPRGVRAEAGEVAWSRDPR